MEGCDVTVSEGVPSNDTQRRHTFQQNNDVQLVELSGDYDIASSPIRLAQELDRAAGHEYVVLDFSGVTYMDSSAIARLIQMRNQRKANELPAPHFAALPPMIQKLFRLLGFHSLWRIHGTVEEAISELKSDKDFEAVKN